MSPGISTCDTAERAEQTRVREERGAPGCLCPSRRWQPPPSCPGWSSPSPALQSQGFAPCVPLTCARLWASIPWPMWWAHGNSQAGSISSCKLIFSVSEWKAPFLVKFVIFCNWKSGTVSLVENDKKSGFLTHRFVSATYNLLLCCLEGALSFRSGQSRSVSSSVFIRVYFNLKNINDPVFPVPWYSLPWLSNSEIRCSQGSVASGNSPGVKTVFSLSTCCHLEAPCFVGEGEESKVGLRVHTLFWCSASLKMKINYLGILFKGLFISKEALSWVIFWVQNRNLKIWVMLDQHFVSIVRNKTVKPRGQVAMLCALSPRHLFHWRVSPSQQRKPCFPVHSVPSGIMRREQEALHF